MKLRFWNDDGFWIDHRVAFALTTVADNSGKLDSVSQFAGESSSNSGATYQVFSVGNIAGCAYVVPEKPFTDPSKNGRWLVNSHIDLMT